MPTMRSWAALRALRAQVTEAIEPLRRDKVLGSSLEAEVCGARASEDPELLAELFITSTVHTGDEIKVAKTANHKCGRCWRHLPEVRATAARRRCEEVVNGATVTELLSGPFDPQWRRMALKRFA